MFMCSSCKFTGQWDFLDHHFNMKKEKNKKLQDTSDIWNHQEKLQESLKAIRESNQVLIDSDKFETILKKFKLPVIIVIKSYYCVKSIFF